MKPDTSRAGPSQIYTPPSPSFLDNTCAKHWGIFIKTSFQLIAVMDLIDRGCDISGAEMFHNCTKYLAQHHQTCSPVVSGGFFQVQDGIQSLRGHFLKYDNFKGSEPGLILPPTSMAAHAVDEVLETIEVEDLEVVETASAGVHKGGTSGIPGLPFPLPPPPPPPPRPVPQNGYPQYQGEDENVDVEALEEEMVDVDIV
ncbi:hypothetical protein CsSME_00027083 [Camellia sinensis var. sinensis]